MTKPTRSLSDCVELDRVAIAERYGERWAQAEFEAEGALASECRLKTFQGSFHTALGFVPSMFHWEDRLELADVVLNKAKARWAEYLTKGKRGSKTSKSKTGKAGGKAE